MRNIKHSPRYDLEGYDKGKGDDQPNENPPTPFADLVYAIQEGFELHRMTLSSSGGVSHKFLHNSVISSEARNPAIGIRQKISPGVYPDALEGVEMTSHFCDAALGWYWQPTERFGYVGLWRLNSRGPLAYYL